MRCTKWRQTLGAAFLSAVLGAGLVGSATAASADWTFETLDGAGGSGGRTTNNVGTDNAVTIYGGQPHVWYYDTSQGDLRHAWWTGTAWSFETLDGAGGAGGRTTNNVGRFNAVTIYGGQPHVWYRDDTAGDLRHAWWNGAAWSFETLDGAGGGDGRTPNDVGFDNAVTIYGGQPHVWYYDGTAGDLRHAWWNGAAWSFETLDGNGGAGGRTTNIVGLYNAVTIYGGQPHVWYYDFSAGDLRHAWWNGTAWSFETLDGDGGAGGRTTNDVGRDNAVTIYGGQPHVWYWDNSQGDLRHAWWNGAAWSFETLDGAGGANGRTTNNVGNYNAVTIYGGQPHVWYRDFSAGDLRHAWYG